MLSVVSVNTELVNTESKYCSQGKCRVRFPPAPGLSISSTSQYVTLFYECFYVKMPYLTYAADSLTLNSWPKACNSCLNDYLTHRLCEAQSLLALRNNRQHFSASFGAILNCEITNKKPPSAKRCGTK